MHPECVFALLNLNMHISGRATFRRLYENGSIARSFMPKRRRKVGVREVRLFISCFELRSKQRRETSLIAKLTEEAILLATAGLLFFKQDTCRFQIKWIFFKRHHEPWI